MLTMPAQADHRQVPRAHEMRPNMPVWQASYKKGTVTEKGV